MKTIDLEPTLKRPFWSAKEIAAIYGYTYVHAHRLTRRAGFPNPQGDPPRYPKHRVIQFMIKIGKEARIKRERKSSDEKERIPSAPGRR